MPSRFGTPLALTKCMSGIIHTVYKLRLLQQKLAKGHGLNMEDVHEFEALERELEDRTLGRKYRRELVGISALVRRPGQDALVQVIDIGPGGMRLDQCPTLQAGDQFELHLRESDKRSFRFQAQVSWTREEQGSCIAGVRFVGFPICINHGPPSESKPASVVDRIMRAGTGS